MDDITTINLLTNSGIKVFGMDDDFLYFQDPSCIFPAFDSILNYAWMAILTLTAFMLMGWAFLYIKNGVKISNLFNNIKNLILIFGVLSVVKPTVDFIYCGSFFDTQCALFARQCETRHVSMASVQELLDLRKKTFGKSDEAMLYETFDIIDSGSGQGTGLYFEAEETENDEDNLSFNEGGSGSFGGSASGGSGSGGGIVTSSNPLNKNSNVAHIESGKGFVIYVLKDGTKIKRSGGSVAWRNNNPGNIIKSKFANSHGGVGSAGRFAVFPDEETGLKATMSLLRGKSYRSLQLRQVYHKWAPTSDGNKPTSYANTVSKKSGISLDRRIQDLSDEELTRVARAMQSVEGWKKGKEERI